MRGAQIGGAWLSCGDPKFGVLAGDGPFESTENVCFLYPVFGPEKSCPNDVYVLSVGGVLHMKCI